LLGYAILSELLTIVEGLYVRYDLGAIVRPSLGMWIHSIPINHQLLRENEIELCQKLTVAFYWAVFAQWTKSISR